ncbi:MAG TPA: hypothetical protein VIA02_01740 [Candidatus Limnocylindria bacterium]
MSRLNLANPRVRRALQAVALGLGIAFAILSIHTGLIWTDGQVYWDAGERVRTGGDLYPSGVDPETAFKYAPWFAWVWAGLTVFPEVAVAVAWTAAMIGAWVFPVVAYLHAGWGERALVFLAGPPLLIAALGGNVQPAVVALLFFGVERRWGPAAIAVAASLKLFPVLFVAVYIGRGQWIRAASAVVLAGALWLPALVFGLDAFPSDIGGAFSLLEVAPVAYAAGVVLTLLWAIRTADWAAGSVSVLVASSVRFIPYQLGYLLCSAPRPAPRGSASGSSTEASTG